MKALRLVSFYIIHTRGNTNARVGVTERSSRLKRMASLINGGAIRQPVRHVRVGTQ